VLSDVSINPRRFRLGRKRCATVNKKAARTTGGKKRKRKRTGCSFAYKVSRGATVVFTIEADSKGRRTGKKCARQTRNNTKLRRCVRRKRLGSFAQRSTAGKNATRFRPKVGRKKLKPGSYRVTLVARDSAGSVSRAVRLEFRIVARKKQFEVLARGKRRSARRGA
jgi:hypothetical protein